MYSISANVCRQVYTRSTVQDERFEHCESLFLVSITETVEKTVNFLYVRRLFSTFCTYSGNEGKFSGPSNSGMDSSYFY
ncbi:hypothetical protein BDZ97DRAFT_1846260 [Flammula alnicola]|nr:hypothetical protein BDZ97DRAFT_1846260 [Flammula alnicola]